MIKLPIDKVDRIYHLSDIHIRNVKRHKEYRSVFKKVYKEIAKNKENSVIYLGGDIVHAKLDMSPELIDLTSEFFTELANLCPLLVLPGNHDCNLNNKHRLDALSPIIRALDNPNIHYIKDSGVYQVGDVGFSVMSVFEEPDSYVKAKDYDSKTKIALYHGSVFGSQTDFGFILPNSDIDKDIFDGFDMVLLGDIHKRQYLNDEKTIAYPGSLIQQNFGEDFGKGFLVWDVEKRDSKFVNVPNDYGYYTINVVNGHIPPLDDLPKYPRLRVKFEKTSTADIKKLIAVIKQKAKVKELAVIRTDKLSQIGQNSSLSKINLGNIRDTIYQNKLIVDYLEQKFNVLDDDTLRRVCKINEELNLKLPNVEVGRNISWKPKKFEFDNMFSYGENNVVDFSNMIGSMGLFASNASGKSSLLDALTYCIFDKCARTFKAVNIMNTDKTTFKCKFNFEIDGVDYFIERRAKKNRKGQVKVDVDFWSEIGGEVKNLNGEQRRETNKSISSYIGSYEDFILTAMSLQNNNTGFIDKSQAEKKDTLAQFLDIGLFDELWKLSNEESNEVSSVIRDLEKQDFSSSIVDLNKELKDLKKFDKEKDKELRGYKKQRDGYLSEIKKISKKIVKVPIDGVSFDELTDKKRLLVESQDSISSELQSMVENKENIQKKVADIQTKINIFDTEKINNSLERYGFLQSNISDINNNINVSDVKLNNLFDSKEDLDKWNPNLDCDSCVTNPLYIKGVEIDEEIDKEEELKESFEKQKIDMSEEMVNLEKFILESKELDKLSETYTHETQQLEVLVFDLDKKNYSFEKLTDEIEEVEKKIEIYRKNSEQIKKNQDIRAQVKVLEYGLDAENRRLNRCQDELTKIKTNVAVCENKIQTIKDSIERLQDLQDDYSAYEYYMEAVKRNGVPYELISSVLPVLENEVNSILSQIVEFNLKFEVDGKNINTFIDYESGRWPLEMTSGMEKFVSSLAIRTSLIGISNLPRPNFLAIDEGFGNLDSDNLNSMFMLFDYLKSTFDFILIISHLDSMRDIMDTLININKVNSFSKVTYPN